MILLIFLQRISVASGPDCNVFTAQCFDNEVGKVKSCSNIKYSLPIGKEVVVVDKNYFRPNEVDALVADIEKVKNKLAWTPSYNIKEIVDDSSNSIESLIMISRKFRETLYDTTPLFIHDLKKYHPDLYEMTQDYKEKLFNKTLQDILSTGKVEGYIRKEINEEIITRLRIEMIESGFNQDIFPLNLNLR